MLGSCSPALLCNRIIITSFHSPGMFLFHSRFIIYTCTHLPMFILQPLKVCCDSVPSGDLFFFSSFIAFLILLLSSILGSNIFLHILIYWVIWPFWLVLSHLKLLKVFPRMFRTHSFSTITFQFYFTSNEFVFVKMNSNVKGKELNITEQSQNIMFICSKFSSLSDKKYLIVRYL